MSGIHFIVGFAAVIAITAAGIFITERFFSGPHEVESNPDTSNAQQGDPHRPSPDFSALIDAIRTESKAARTEEEREDRGKKFRDYLTICLLAVTLFYLKRQVDEMTKVYDPIKAQSDAATAQIAEMAKQSSAMQGQLEEMKTASIIQKAQLAARMQVDTLRNPTANGFEITLQWTNVGKTDAVDFRAWKDFQVFQGDNFAEAVNKADFRQPMHIDHRDNPQETIIPGDKRTYETNVITFQDAQNVIDSKAFIVSWGHAEYKDVFGVQYSIGVCNFFVFERIGALITITLPHHLRPECGESTQQQPEKNR